MNTCKALVLSYMDVQEPGRIHCLGDSNGNPRGTPSADVRRFTSVAKADFLQQLYRRPPSQQAKIGLAGRPERPAPPSRGHSNFGCALVVQVHPCEQFLEPWVFAKIVIPRIDFNVRDRRGVLFIRLLQKRHDFLMLG